MGAKLRKSYDEKKEAIMKEVAYFKDVDVLLAELLDYGKVYGITPVQLRYNSIYYADYKFKVIFGDLEFFGKGPTDKLSRKRAIGKALDYLRSVPIPEKTLFEEFHELSLKHGITPLFALDNNTAKIKLGGFLAEDSGPTSRVAVEWAVLKSVKFMRACEFMTTSTQDQGYYKLKEDNRLTLLQSLEHNNDTLEDLILKTQKPTFSPMEDDSNSGSSISSYSSAKDDVDQIEDDNDNSSVDSNMNNNNTMEALMCLPLDSSMSSEEIQEYLEPDITLLRQAPELPCHNTNITTITHVDNIHNTPVGVHNTGQKETREKKHAVPLLIRLQANFPKEFEMTPDEEQGVMDEAVRDVIDHFETPELLLKSASQPHNTEFKNILSEKISARYKIFKRKKSAEQNNTNETSVPI